MVTAAALRASAPLKNPTSPRPALRARRPSATAATVATPVRMAPAQEAGQAATLAGSSLLALPVGAAAARSRRGRRHSFSATATVVLPQPPQTGAPAETPWARPRRNSAPAALESQPDAEAATASPKVGKAKTLSGRTALAFQDSLYSKHCRQHGALPEGRAEYRRELLWRLQSGDVAWLREELQRAEPGSWDFVYPPKEGGWQEGWCRSPLSLLVLPKEPFLQEHFLPGVPDQTRLRLVQEALEKGVASAHIEGSYWSCPAIHAALSGDVEVLKLLHAAGLDLASVRVKWSANVTEQFGIAHAAAMNGHVEALQWLVSNVRRDEKWLDLPDSAGNTALYYAVHTARSTEAATFLLSQGCDPFRFNEASGRSPLSAAIELLPKAAKAFLEAKTSLNDAWWGNPVHSYDFEGIAVAEGQRGQLRFRSEKGDWVSIEGLISRSGNTELASTPVMQRLTEKKWEAWGKDHFNHIFGFFGLVATSYIWEALFGSECGGFMQMGALACTYVGWFGYAWTQIRELESRGKQFFSYGWNILDTLILALVPMGTVPHLFDAVGLHLDALPTLGADGSVLDAFALLLMCVRLCRFIAVVSEPCLAQYLRAILDILALSWKPLGFLGSVVGTFAGAFTLIFRAGTEKSVSYTDTVCQLLHWLFEPDNGVDAIKDLPMAGPGFALFILFFSTAVLGSLRLVQDSVNLPSMASGEEAKRQFQALRTEVVDDLEQLLHAASSCPWERRRVREFYRELREGGKVLNLEMRTEPWLQGM